MGQLAIIIDRFRERTWQNMTEYTNNVYTKKY